MKSLIEKIASLGTGAKSPSRTSIIAANIVLYLVFLLIVPLISIVLGTFIVNRWGDLHFGTNIPLNIFIMMAGMITHTEEKRNKNKDKTVVWKSIFWELILVARMWWWG